MAAVAFAAGCGGKGTSPVGNGVGPSELLLTANSTTETSSPNVVRIFQCFVGGVAATLRFTDGSAGNFTARVTYSSSDPSVVQISNGDIPVSDGSGFYVKGTLVPVSPGNATVTASYSGLNAQLQVSVGAPSSFTILQTVETLRIPTTGGVSLGVGTLRPFSVSAVEDGVSHDVSDSAQWSLDKAVGFVSSTGVVFAQGAGGPTPLQATFLPCASSVISTDITVANITAITTQPEFGTDPVLLNNSERFVVAAALDNGATQDISSQATLTSTNTTVATFDAASSNILVPVTVGSATIQASFNNTFTAPDVIANVTESTLNSITVAPSSAVLRANSDEYVQFVATGTYLNGQTQNVTRAVTWAAVDPSLVGISNLRANAGVASPGTLVGQTQITATPPTSDSAASLVAATVTVDSTTNPATGAP